MARTGANNAVWVRVFGGRNNTLRDAGARMLAEALLTNVTLKALDLRCAQTLFSAFFLNDAQLNCVSCCCARKIFIDRPSRSNGIGVDGARALGKALVTNTSLTTLSLRWVPCSNVVAQIGADVLSGVRLFVNPADIIALAKTGRGCLQRPC
jgi:hypothetical protein